MTDTKHTPGAYIPKDGTYAIHLAARLSRFYSESVIKDPDARVFDHILFAVDKTGIDKIYHERDMFKDISAELLEALEKICRLYEVREHIGENCADGYEAVDYALSVLSKVKGGAA